MYMADFWLRRLASEEEEWIREYFSEDEDFLEALGLNEGNSGEELSLDENWIVEHGFIFEAKTVAKQECVVEIVIIGDGNCGKSQLIESVFGDHESLTVTNYETRDEYYINLSEKASFHILIYDVKDIEFLMQTYFRYKTVFLFCYAVDDPESLANVQEIWIPAFLQRHMIRMYCFVMGIECDPKTHPNAATMIDDQEQKIAIREKAAALCRRLRSGRLLGCSTADKNSIVNAFQSLFDAVYPWVSW